MIDYLPLFMRKSKVYQSIFNADGQQLDQFKVDKQDVKRQLNIDTATWGLAFYEKDLKIPIDINKPLAERRSVIKSRFRGTGKIGASQMKLVADAYTNGNVDVSFDGGIIFKFTSIMGIPPNMSDLQKVIEQIKPAHLGVTYIYLFNTNQTLSQLTNQQLASFTHDQLKNEAVI